MPFVSDRHGQPGSRSHALTLLLVAGTKRRTLPRHGWESLIMCAPWQWRSTCPLMGLDSGLL